ncbi:hypothetical protein MMC25_006076 [Agyrium rufum]|nr:hypothetical protein [Agyrium rufum]
MTSLKYPLVEKIGQSPPLEFPGSIDDSWVKDKVILITGGASGFGAGFVRRWAKAGAFIVIGDVNTAHGEALVEEIQSTIQDARVHFYKCDVTDWNSQVQLFKETVRLSPHHGIDTVIANAGIIDKYGDFENPRNIEVDDPRPPRMDVLDVNLKGVAYTSHLALYYLPRNPGSSMASAKCKPEETSRDRHLMLLGSIASLAPIAGEAFYGASKHAVLGLYRCLRTTSFQHGIRVSLLCPYFIDTPLFGSLGRLALAGAVMGKVEDVVEAASRFVCDPRIVGRAVTIGPKLRVVEKEEGGWDIVDEPKGVEHAIWEIYSNDFEDTEVFTRNVVALLNRATEAKGWIGWFQDIRGAIAYGLRLGWKR